eukprot:4220998-Alexandrium_andersonii.AAC.1
MQGAPGNPLGLERGPSACWPSRRCRGGRRPLPRAQRGRAPPGAGLGPRVSGPLRLVGPAALG